MHPRHTETNRFPVDVASRGNRRARTACLDRGTRTHDRSESAVWLWPIEVDETPQSADRLVFLLSESLRQMAEDRVEVVRTVSDSAKTAVTSVLTRLGFRNATSGVVLEKRYMQISNA